MKKHVLSIMCITVLAICMLGCNKSFNEVEDNTQNIVIDNRHKMSVISLLDGNNIYGHVVDEEYNPISNVVVSDGFTLVLTNEKGEYQFRKNENASYVFYSTPSEYEVNTSADRRMALFYSKLSTNSNVQRVDFVLNKLAKIENNFSLYAIGDPQVANMTEVNRFINETMTDIKGELAKSSLPVYGISLGDVVADQPSLFNVMKTAMGSSSMPVFTTIGNHDKTGGDVFIARNSTSFESQFGPLNYSFNRGDVHFVCLDNVVFSDNNTYNMNFSDRQIDWLEKDLSFVSKNKLLIIYYHMPLRTTSFSTRNRLFSIIKDFKEVHLMAGHTHYNENYIHNIDGKQIYEHIHAASCGAWWKSTINGDGTPNGYAKYDIEGTTIKKWLYKATNLSSDFQMRLHWGNSSFGGSFGNFSYGKSSKTLIANVWNADPTWKIEAFVNNEKIGDMSLNTSLSKDAWSLGYHLGVLNRNVDNYTTATKHLYSLDLPNTNGIIKVLATDRFGNRFEEYTITTSLDAAIGY